jgi:DNA polymerase III delta subunit
MTLFFYGPNVYALRVQLRQMTRAYLAKAQSDFGLERIDGSAVRAQDLTASLRAVPFMANSRLVIIENLAANKGFGGSFTKLLGQVPATTVAVFVER